MAMEDRRVFARIKLKIPLRFLDPNTGKECEAETVNISANGVGLITKEKLAVRTPLEMWLKIPDHHEPFYTRGEVVWSEAFVDGEYQSVGVCLEDVDLIGLARAIRIDNNATY